jgi:predicted ATPase
MLLHEVGLMEEIFISEINIEKARVVKDLFIPLSDSERKHLIITGKNGSGKTSVLLELNKYLHGLLNKHSQNLATLWTDALNKTKRELLNLRSAPSSSDTNNKIVQLQNNIRNYENHLGQFGTARIFFQNEHLIWEKAINGTFIIVYFDAQRQAKINVPTGINKIDLQDRYNLSPQTNQHFIQYIVNLKADRSFAKDDGEVSTVSEIDKWFENFEQSLRDICDSPSLELKFDRKTYNFQLVEKDKEPYTFNTLSDGYSSIISIVTELILRMEAHGVKNYDMQGLVLIDEIETHLHVELQKKILPFLINFFPKIQFIVSTHSPFILSSVSNSVICDLETKIVTSDLSAYSYDAIIESYFYSDKYSDLIKDMIIEYEELLSKEIIEPEEKERLRELKKYFSAAPKYLSTELQVKLQELELKYLHNKV